MWLRGRSFTPAVPENGREFDLRTLQNQTFEQERALYGSRGLHLAACRFDGPADGESALKECADITAEDCFFNLRYPLWHVHGLRLQRAEMTEKCRAALWYSDHIEIGDSRLHGIKALRECADVRMTGCDVVSPEFGWSTHRLTMRGCTADSEYFLLRASEIEAEELSMTGKYSFQYIENAVFERCRFDTKDAFWHAKNVTVRDSVIKGEYLAWYCENVTFERCRIIGTQPLCYCKGLRLIDCEMEGTDLAFEKSEVDATLKTPVLSIKNPRSGYIQAPAAGEVIRDDPESKAEIVLGAAGA